MGREEGGGFRMGNIEWVAISSPGDLPNPGMELLSPALAGRFFTTELPMGCLLSQA